MASFNNYSVIVKILSGNSPCDFFNVYYNQVNNNNLALIIPGLAPATNITYNQLTSGLTVRVPDSATTILISGTCTYCPVFTQVLSGFYRVRLGNSTLSVCNATITTVYVNAANYNTYNLSSGFILYTDDRLTTQITGFAYVVQVDIGGTNISNIFTLTNGIVGSNVGSC